MNVNTSTSTQQGDRFTGFVVSNAQIDAAERELAATGQKISSVRVGDTFIGMTSRSGRGLFCMYTLDGLYLGVLRGEYDDQKNIVHWRLPTPGWFAKLSGTPLAQEAADFLSSVAEDDERCARRGHLSNGTPEHLSKAMELKRKARAMNLL